MLDTDIPTKIPVPFGTSAVGGDIRTIPLTTTDPNAASFTAGFPPPCFSPISGGGVAPDGRDFNGLLLQITQWSRWQAAGGTALFDPTFATAVGGYPAGSILRSVIPGNYWVNTVNNNTTNPDSGGAGWTPLGPSTGDAKLTLKTVADYGWILMNDGTIGGASSNATTLASADASALFALIWTNVVNTWAPLLNSAGAPVARGLTASADFLANRQLTLTRQLGRAIGVSGAGSGLTSRALGQFLGEETHQLTTAELAAHNHVLTDPGHHHTFAGSSNAVPRGTVSSAAIVDGSNPSTSTSTTGINIAAAGGDTAHNNMQPTSFWNVMIKL